jgi:hypothetical protein
MNHLAGSLYVLAKLPIWATAAIFAAIGLAILVGRDIFEGLPYNVAYSAAIGDVALTIGVLIAATILQRGGVRIPELLQKGEIHIMIAAASFGLGTIVCSATLNSRSGKAMDVFHDLVIAPLFLYLAVTLMPIILINGRKTEIIATTCSVLLWLGLVGFDAKYNRLNQRQWLQNHDVVLKN